MIGWLKKLMGSKVQLSKADLARQRAAQRARLKSGNTDDMRDLAGDAATDPEILYYLAKSDDAQVRRAVAINAATPVQASTMLANDRDIDVRFALAARLIELLPELSEDKYSQLYAYTVQALGVLAQDEVIKIRQALSSALKDFAKAPPTVVARLARDVERIISEPILRFCVALADDDLLDILSQHPEPWMISAIAGRPVVSDDVSGAVVRTGDTAATGLLISNKGASLSADTLQTIIDKARTYPEWHQSVALRPELTVDLAQQLAGFVGEAVLTVLEKRSDFDAPTRHQVVDIVKRRLAYQRGGGESGADKVARYVRDGALTPEVIHDAAVWQDWDFFYAALSVRSGINPDILRKMMTSGAAKPLITACYCAQIPMRMCIEFQRIVGKLQPRNLVYAKGGTDYPLTAQDMTWQLEFFGIKGPLPSSPH